MNKKLSILLRVFIGILILILLIYKLDFSEVYKTILETKFIVIFLIVFDLFFMLLVNSWLIQIPFKTLKINVKFWTLFKKYSLSWSVGRFFLGRVGEFSLAHFLEPKGVSYGQSISTTLQTKIIQALSWFIISLFGIFLFLGKEDAIKSLLFLIILALLASLLVFSKKIRGLIKKYILGKYAYKFKGTIDNFYVLIRNKRLFFICLLINLVRSIVISFFVSFMFLSYGVKVPFFTIVVINSLSTLVATIPITIGGLGIKEVTAVYFFASLGVNALVAGSIYILTRFIHYIIAVLILIFFKGGLVKWQD